MNIVVRNMIYADIESLSQAFSSQGWILPLSVFEHYYTRVLQRFCDLLIAEVKGQPAGFVHLEWVDTGEETGHALIPEIQEFIVLGKFTATGVAEAMSAEVERRIASITGDISGNVLMAVYGTPPPRPHCKYNFVLDGLLVSHDGKFIRAKSTGAQQGGMVISMAKRHKI